jgi:biopolymer transport protein ExbB
MKNSVFVKFQALFATLTIVILVAFAWVLYLFVLGNPANFHAGDPANHPLPDNYLGIIYKGGVIVPFLMSFLMMVVVFSLERLWTIRLAQGRGSIDAFILKVKNLLAGGSMEEAMQACDKQKGSVGNVVRSVLGKYKEVETEKELNKEQKVLSIEKELEDSTALEMPMLEKNLSIIATLASIATLVGLLGTVIGMIKAFSVLATAGAPDSIALANGISEALINTALGIATSALAIVAYNFFTTRIDALSYNIEEVGMSIIQNFKAQVKN